MKALQNNFTTPEQSKRLLELGVPADSADCVITIITECIYAVNIIPNHRVFSDIKEELQLKRGKEIIPCFSVGRLIEIFTTCAEYYTGDNSLVFNRESVSLGNINCLISVIELAVKDKCINFSKLEE